MPVSTSPVPPVAMAGEPVGLIHTRPSGNAITLRLPFQDQVDAVIGRERSRAVRCDPFESRRSISRSGATSRPDAASECAARRSATRCPASAFSASASTTMGAGDSCTKRRMNCTVSGCCPMPGPIAMTFFFSVIAANAASSDARTAMAPESVSASGSVMISGAYDAIAEIADAADATVDSPAPDSQRRDACHRGCACLSAPARDHQHVPVSAFVRFAGVAAGTSTKSRTSPKRTANKMDRLRTSPAGFRSMRHVPCPPTRKRAKARDKAWEP